MVLTFGSKAFASWIVKIFISVIVGNPDELRGRFKLRCLFFDLSFNYDAHCCLKTVRLFLAIHLVLQVLSWHWLVQIAFIVTTTVRDLLPHFVCDLAKIYEVVGNV